MKNTSKPALVKECKRQYVRLFTKTGKVKPRVWYVEKYARSEKAWLLIDFEDISHGVYVKGATPVFTDFEF